MLPKKAKIKKTHAILLVAILLGLGISTFLQHRWSDAVIELKGEPLYVLVAKNGYQLHKGLGKRTDLGDFDGMLFLFAGENKRPGIVMRDMQFPLDIIWIQRGIVIDIAPNVPIEPGKEEQDLIPYYPRTTANIVLELPAGWVDQHELKIGDTLTVLDE